MVAADTRFDLGSLEIHVPIKYSAAVTLNAAQYERLNSLIVTHTLDSSPNPEDALLKKALAALDREKNFDANAGRSVFEE